MVVRALPGAGKSYQIYQRADEVYAKTGKPTLVLTFSRLLKNRGREQTAEKPQILVHSFHSSVQGLFNITCYLTDHFSKFVNSNPFPCPTEDIKQTLLLCIDETQDIDEEIASYINLLRPHLHQDHKMMVVGDGFQNVFRSLRNSSTKFLDDPATYFGGEWEEVFLNESYRLPPPISSFINKYLNPNMIKLHYPKFWNDNIAKHWGPGIISHPSTHVHQDPVDFHRFRFYKDNIPESSIQTVKHFIKEYGSASVMVIVKSCKFSQRHPAGQLIAACPEAKWIVLKADTGEDANLLQNKAIIATPWKVKGSEAKLVIFAGFDSTLERDDPLLAYSLALVAASRAQMKLIVWSNSSHELFFTMREQLTNLNTFTSSSMNISDLVTYNRFDPIWDCMESSVQEKCDPVSMDTQIQTTRTLCEPVGMFYEIALRKAVIHSLGQDAHPDWLTLVHESIKMSTELCHVKRQLPPLSSWVDCAQLDAILEKTLDLMPESSQFEPSRGVKLASDTKCVYGIIYLVLDDHTLLNLQFSKEFGYAQGQEISLMGEVFGMSENVNPESLKLLIVNPIAGERRLVTHKPGLLHAMLKRKNFI
jgi:hypothetical protein